MNFELFGFDKCETGRKIPLYKMFFLAFIMMLPCMMDGFVEGYVTLALPEMKLTVTEASWFGSIASLVAPVGTIVMAILVDAVGRKTALLVGIAPHLIGWSLLTWNRNTTVALVGRMFTGLSKGSLFYPSQVYVVESLAFDNRRLRSSLATWSGMTSAFGLSTIVSLSYFFDHRLISAFAAATSFAMLAMIYATVPESPTWLYLQGRDGDAELALKALGVRGSPLLGGARNGDATPYAVARPAGGKFAWSDSVRRLRPLTQKNVYKPLLILTVAYVILPFTGAAALLTYLVDIIGADPNATADDGRAYAYAYQTSVWCGLLILAAHTSTVFAVPLLGVKPLTIPSCVCVAAGYVYLGYAADADWYAWRSLAVWLVVFTFHSGVEAAPLAVMGDSFPADAKRFAAVPMLTLNLCTGLVIKWHPYLAAELGGRIYYAYAGVALCGALFVTFCFYETVGKTVDEISERYLR